MPITKAAYKHLRQTKLRTEQNKAMKENLRRLLKKTKRAIESGNLTDAQTELKKTLQALDKAARRGVLKKNAAARKKSRLSRALNVLAKGQKSQTS